MFKIRQFIQLGVVFLLFALPKQATAVCSESNLVGVQTGSQGLKVGQSFTVGLCSSGSFTSIQVISATNNSDVTLKIYQGSGFAGTVIHMEKNVALSIGINEVALSSMVPFVNGQTYTFSFEVSGGFLDLARNSLGADIYTGGTLFDADGMSVGLDDLHFIVNTNAFILPVELTRFDAFSKDKAVLLKWETASESENAGFEVERSQDAKNWETIGFVEGNGTSFVARNYQFSDANPYSGLNYYRLKQMDYDGQFEYSPITAVANENAGLDKLEVFPNPAALGQAVQIKHLPESVNEVLLFDLTRQVVYRNRNPKDSLEVLLPNNLTAGVYALVLVTDSGKVTKKLVFY